MADRSVADIARRQAKERPRQTALWFEGQTVSYAELDELSSRCANALLAAGVKPGDRVAQLAKGNADFFVLWFGCLKAGACLNPVNWRLAPPEIAFIVNDAGAQVLIVGQDYASVVPAILGEMPKVRHLVQMESGHPRWPGFREWIAGYPATDPMREVQPDDDVIQLYTSGTTGLPKGVMLTEQNYAALFVSATQAWAKFDAGDAALVAMPLFHVAGANMGLLGLLQGATDVILKEADPAVILRTIAEHRIRQAFLVPALINMVLQRPELPDTDISCWDRIYYGASPISEAVLREAQDRLGCDFTQLYGLTETIGIGTYLSPEAHAEGRLRACGRPSPEVELRIRTEGRDAEIGEVGEIEIRSRGVMKGYWNRPEATAEAIDKDGWFRTGDAGYLDQDGYLFIHDRVKDMIVSGGENVYPAEVENALMSHPGIADAAVIGVPDERWGEAVKGIVVMRPGQTMDAAEIIAHCRTRIAGYKTPKSIDVIDVLPRNPSGKVLRRELRKPYWEGHGRLVG